MSLADFGSEWINKLADQQEMSSPDGRLKRRIKAEKDAIKEALETVGEYVMEVDGVIYTFRNERRAALEPK